MALTWSKAAGGGTGAIVSAYLVEALDKAMVTYLQMPIPEIVQLALLGALTGLVTYYFPKNAERPVQPQPTNSSESGV